MPEFVIIRKEEARVIKNPMPLFILDVQDFVFQASQR